MIELQTAAHVLMIRPVRFTANLQTAASNHFQQLTGAADQDLQLLARNEFDSLVTTLRTAGVNVVVFEDTPEPHTPDALFPNNWFSLHADGTAVLYPMCAANRRLERRPALIQALAEEHGFELERTLDLTHHEAADAFLEGTGSLVLDRPNRIAYACLSARTTTQALQDFAQHLRYEVVTFHAADAAGAAIYHTNVMLSLGRHFAAICIESVRPEDRAQLLQRLNDSGRHIIPLSHQQLTSFAGNMLELQTRDGGAVVAMSDRARASLTDEQRDLLERLAGPILSCPIPTIERAGGGSVRCMLAEIHLPYARASSP